MTDSQPKLSSDVSEQSENTKWLQYGKDKVRNGEILEFIQDRVYLLDSNSEPPSKRSIENMSSIINAKSLLKKCRALSRKIKPLNDKFDTDYTTLEIIGNGNFGQVFKTKNNRNGKICAVKKSKLQFISYKDRAAKEEEVRKWSVITAKQKLRDQGKFPPQNKSIASALSSHCIELYEAWEENGFLFSSSEYCENGNLAEWHKSLNIKMSKRSVFKCILDMALGIKQVHD